MEGMGFGTDVGAFTNAENHITGDVHSKNCLKNMGFVTDDGKFHKAKFTALINQLRGKTLAQVLGSAADAAQLSALFDAADKCIEAAGCNSA